MFEELAQLAEQRHAKFTVMADDLTFSGEGADGELLNEARLIVRRHGLVSNRKKERVMRGELTKVVTGVVLTKNGPRLPNKLRERIHELYSEVRKEPNPMSRAALYQRLVGSLFSAQQIERKFYDQGHEVLRKWKADRAAWAANRRIAIAKA
jgi:hypothetical protein